MSAVPRKPIYLDYQATTPLDPRVFAAMRPFLEEHFGNPHSAEHAYGWIAHEAVEEARRHVATVIAARPEAIIFTSGATESNNLAIRGVFAAAMPQRDHLVTVATEHKCVLENARWIARHGGRVTILPVDRQGLVDLDRLCAAIDDRTALVSVMAVNNEIGTIQPLAEIGALCRERGVYFHTDAAQGFGKIPIDVDEMGIDLLSISAHKVYGPKGVGALYVRTSAPRVRIAPLILGGGQERGLRSGTLAPHQCVGLGEAARIAGAEMVQDAEQAHHLFCRLWQGLQDAVPDIRLNGPATKRWWGNCNVTIPGVRAEDLMARLPDLAISSGAACGSGSGEPSYVLQAIGRTRHEAEQTLRIGFGRFTTTEEIDHAVTRIAEAVAAARANIRMVP